MNSATQDPAPIMMSTYRRLDHVRESLAALARNPLASRSTLYLTSDGPMPGHKEEVFRVRRFLESIEGFGRVELRFFDRNERMQIWNQRCEIGRSHGRYIYLEEDCVTASGFLGYMNACLDRYAGDPSVFSIAGYTPPVAAIRRPSPKLFRVASYNVWGVGLWERSDRLIRPSIRPEEFHDLLRSRILRKKVHASLGAPFWGMLRQVAEGRLYAANDVMARLEILTRDLVSIFPSQSFVRNDGFDGTGEHCGEVEAFHVELFDRTDIDWANLPEETSTAVNLDFARFYGGTVRNRLRFWSKYLRGKMTAHPALSALGQG